MSLFPTLWQHLKCRLWFAVDAEKGQNYRTKGALVELFCPHCKEWTEPVAPNGTLR